MALQKTNESLDFSLKFTVIYVKKRKLRQKRHNHINKNFNILDIYINSFWYYVRSI